MGQLLSVPMVIAGIWLLWWARRKHAETQGRRDGAETRKPAQKV